MREHRKHFPVNWIAGMKITRDHFIDQDLAWTDALYETTAINVSPLRYGIIPPSASKEKTFEVSLSLNKQESVTVSVLACQAVTLGGIRISIPAVSTNSQPDGDTVLTETLLFPQTKNETTWWVLLFVEPFTKQPAGTINEKEIPVRRPYLLPVYSLKLVSNTQYKDEEKNASNFIPIGMLTTDGNEIDVEEGYTPPCFSVNALPYLEKTKVELDKYLTQLELYCSRTIQKIYTTRQDSDISKQVMLLCQNTIAYVAQAITTMRWKIAYEPPVEMFLVIATLARVIKNTIDLRIGSGKDELMSYMSDWSELNKGKLDTLLVNMAEADFDNNNINDIILQVIEFVNTTKKLFRKVSELDLIVPAVPEAPPPPPPDTVIKEIEEDEEEDSGWSFFGNKKKKKK